MLFNNLLLLGRYLGKMSNSEMAQDITLTTISS